MKVPEIVARFDRFGTASAERIESGDVIFHLEGNFDGLGQLESLISRIDNLPTARITLTGTNNKALLVIRIRTSEFETLPPYLT